MQKNVHSVRERTDLPQNVQFEAYILIKTGSHLYEKWIVSGTLVKRAFF